MTKISLTGGSSAASTAATASASGGSAGGGNNTYSTEQADFTASVTDASNNIVLSVDSIGGASITEAHLANGILKVYDADVAELKTITLDKYTWTSGTKTIDTSLCTDAFTFATGDVVSLTLTGPDKSRDTPLDATRALELSPLWARSSTQTIADVTNETSGTNYYYLDMAGYRYFSIQAETSGATPTDTLTITIEASLQDDGTAAASCAYQDVTNALFGVASWVDTDFIAIQDTPVAFKYVRVKTVTAGGSNDADYTIYAKRIF